MTLVDLVKFVAAEERPILIGGIGQGGAADALVKRFGDRWRKTPVKGCWCLESDGLQFTMVRMGDQWDIAAYPYDTKAEFRQAFEEKTHCANAVYFQTKPGDKYTGVAVIRWMQQNGYMS